MAAPAGTPKGWVWMRRVMVAAVPWVGDPPLRELILTWKGEGAC